MTLDTAIPGHEYRIESISGSPSLVQRLMELGLLEGDSVKILNIAPLGDPMEIEVQRTRLTLRKSEAAGIQITPL